MDTYTIDFNKPVHVHFIGIGGISMSGLAAVLLGRGFRVTGSDAKASPVTELLEKEGAQVMIGQKAENILPGTDLVVYTAAIHPDNPEFAAAKAANIPMLTRAELLGQIMDHYPMSVAVAGTHGKTTTTSMLSCILLAAGKDPTISVGGMLKEIGGNIRVGASGNFVTEACEYTNSFLSLKPKIGIVLNIDADHLDFFKDLDDIRHSFRLFAEGIHEGGTLIIDRRVPDLKAFTEGLSCRVITVGPAGSEANEDGIAQLSCSFTPVNYRFDEQGAASFELLIDGESFGEFTLHVPGEHNICNAAAAIAAARLMGCSAEECREGLSRFGGADRRFQKKGTMAPGVTVIDDYAHHPTEISATLTAAKNFPHKRVICVFQPHTYTRTQALLEDFAQALTLADEVVLAPIYAAREKNTIGITSDTLCERILAHGGSAVSLPDFAAIEAHLRGMLAEGDLLITMGAGDVVRVGEELLAADAQ